MPDYKRVQVEVGGIKFYPQEARYSVTRDSNQVGRRIGESLRARAYVWVDAKDTARLSQDDMIQLWKLATNSKDEPERVSITYYQDDDQRVLTNVEFMGSIAAFETFNPQPNGATFGRGNFGSAPVTSENGQFNTGYGNILYMELVAALDDPNVPKHKLTK
jgi:hypothetical protein